MISGSFDALQTLSARLRWVAGATAHEQLAKKLAREAKKLVADEFKQSTDPRGVGWAPLREQRKRQGKKKRSDKVLINSGNLKGSFSTVESSRGFRIGSDRNYAKFHQLGTRNMSRRRLFPYAGEITRVWADAFSKITDKHIRDALEGK